MHLFVMPTAPLPPFQTLTGPRVHLTAPQNSLPEHKYLWGDLIIYLPSPTPCPHQVDGTPPHRPTAPHWGLNTVESKGEQGARFPLRLGEHGGRRLERAFVLKRGPELSKSFQQAYFVNSIFTAC